MFKNRAIQVKMVKTDKNEQTAQDSDPGFEGKVYTITNAIEFTIKKLGAAAIAYVAVDTVRQILIQRATHR